MKFHPSYILSAEKIISGFDGSYPLTQYLKQFFAANKKFGGRDRKMIANLCYEYYRMGCAGSNLSFREKLTYAHFLCNKNEDESIRFLDDSLAKKMDLDTKKKLELLSLNWVEIFPFNKQLSPQINREAFAFSFFEKPDTFLRIRPGRKNAVQKKMEAAGVKFNQEGNDGVRIGTPINLEEIIVLNKDAVVQDISSQRVLDFLDQYNPPPVASVWDCCAASGGKAILAHDKLAGKIRLTLSDIRQSILSNLKIRLGKAGVPIYHLVCENLEQTSGAVQGQPFDIIICDVPCTGSGTWGRTPEQLYFFKEKSIAEYVQRQKKIANNASKNLKSGGLLFYITCSVFNEENEGVIQFLSGNGLQLMSQEYIVGYGQKADTMFAAVLRKVS